MRLIIDVEESDPPQGTVSIVNTAKEQLPGRPPVQFDGWLGMLRALNELLGADPPD